MTTPDDAATIMQRHERHMETPRDPYHRPRARCWSPAAPRKPDAKALQLNAVSCGSRRWRCR
jgi:hypothetical protein